MRVRWPKFNSSAHATRILAQTQIKIEFLLKADKERLGFLTWTNAGISENFSFFSAVPIGLYQTDPVSIPLQPCLTCVSVVICPFFYYIHENWKPAPNSKMFHHPSCSCIMIHKIENYVLVFFFSAINLTEKLCFNMARVTYQYIPNLWTSNQE